MYSFEVIPKDELNISEFSSLNKTVFSTLSWVNFIAEDNGAKPVFIRITNNNNLEGYFSGLLFNKFGVRILGSPFRGWSTCFMGLDLYNKNSKIKIIPELIKFIFKNLKCIYLEIVDRDISLCEAKYLQYKSRLIESLELNIDKSQDQIFKGFKMDCRNFVRQFERRGAKIEIAEPNDDFAEEYYDQLKDVFAKQGLAPTYSVKKVKTLLRNLKDTGMLLCLKVIEPNGRCIASSIFPGYKDKFFFWGGASYREFQMYRPNEYMIWYAIKYWKGKGAKIFDMVGVRDYKLKFGTEKVEYSCILASKYSFLFILRDLAEKLYFATIKFKGLFLKDAKEPQKYNKLDILKKINQEIVHFADDSKQIFSKFNKVKICHKNNSHLIIKLPVNLFQRIVGFNRLTRRLFRLDKSCVVITQTGIVAFWQGKVYHVANGETKPRLVLKMTGCRNPLHNSIVNINGMELYFGEYGQPHPKGKSIYYSPDGGNTWNKIYNISCEKIRHIHSCKWDPYEKKIWVFTGDFDGQSYVLCADKEFKDVEWIGDGSQYFRAVDAVFEKDSVHWIMDSPLSEVHHITLERSTRKIKIGQEFAGPVWYMKKLDDGLTVACTAQEIGPSLKDKYMHLMVTKDLKQWNEITQFKHDGMKKGIMKFGVASFAEGSQTSDNFYIHFEAVRGLDGKCCLCNLQVQ